MQMENKKAIRCEVQLTSFTSRADGSLGVRLVTPELNSEEKVAFMNLQNLLVDALFYPKEERDAEVIEVKKDLDCKSQSQRLRSVLFLLYQQNKENCTFLVFYERYIERFINHIKIKLDEDPKK